MPTEECQTAENTGKTQSHPEPGFARHSAEDGWGYVKRLGGAAEGV